MTNEERQTVIDALEASKKEFDGLPRSLGYDFTHMPLVGRALAIMRREKACKYPQCVDNGPDGKCTAWLIGDCEGPKHD